MRFINVILLLTIFYGCQQQTKPKIELSKAKFEKVTHHIPINTQISSGKNLADSPFLTKDEKGNPVLSWVEGKEDSVYMYYSKWDSLDNKFENPMQIDVTFGLTAGGENMPKIGFKENGEMMVLFSKRTPTKQNRFAGAIYYSESKDGILWSDPKYLHYGDTTKGVGRSFYDIAMLQNGELGVIWLDGRKKSKKGSTLMFASTEIGKSGFCNEKEIAHQTCQCCRTDLFVDSNGKINIAFRDIVQDSIRDIAYIYSKDNGSFFTKPKRIYEDDWVIYGCPHTGPTMTEFNNQILFYWYSGGIEKGVFEISGNEKLDFSLRKMMNANIYHPQTHAINNKVYLVFEEDNDLNRKIRLFNKSKNSYAYLTSENSNAEYPVITSTNNGKVIVAFTKGKGENKQVYYVIQ